MFAFFVYLYCNLLLHVHSGGTQRILMNITKDSTGNNYLICLFQTFLKNPGILENGSAGNQNLAFSSSFPITHIC